MPGGDLTVFEPRTGNSSYQQARRANRYIT
jgi:hypothetical protein